ASLWLIFSFVTKRPSALAMPALPASARAMSMSARSTSWPAPADTCAIPAPICPAPMTPTIMICPFAGNPARAPTASQRPVKRRASGGGTELGRFGEDQRKGGVGIVPCRDRGPAAGAEQQVRVAGSVFMAVLAVDRLALRHMIG